MHFGHGETELRKLGDLPEDQKKRLTNYIREYRHLSTETLANDLYLSITSVRTTLGNITKKLKKRGLSEKADIFIEKLAEISKEKEENGS